MRSCRPFAEPSSVDEVKTTCDAVDESGDLNDLILHISALARSEDIKNVSKTVQTIERIMTSELTPEQLSNVEFLKVLVLYRLKEDRECKKYCDELLKQGKDTQHIHEILKIINDEEKETKVSQGLIVAGTAAAAIGGIAAIIGIFLRRRK